VQHLALGSESEAFMVGVGGQNFFLSAGMLNFYFLLYIFIYF
jgi:hypothetical protein